jgi:hypothetical protein
MPAEASCWGVLYMQGLLEKQPSLRLDWPQLLDNGFLAETAADKEREAREAAMEGQQADPNAASTQQSGVEGELHSCDGLPRCITSRLLVSCAQRCW